LADASLKQTGRGREPPDLVGEHVHRFGARIGSAVGAVTLEMLPDAFVGIPDLLT
jgi:hypothetical protein